MKYHGCELKKVYDADVIGGKYYEVYKDGKYITCCWTLRNAMEFIDSGFNYNVLA